MKILVTGGAGYIGSHTVVELINAGYEPVIADNFCNSDPSVLEGLKRILGREVTCRRGDCCDEAFLREVFSREGDIRGAVHFAALKAVGESMDKPDEYRRNNLGSLESLMTVMQEFQASLLVFSSSACVYGQADQLPVTEETPLKPPESPYGETKQRCEFMIRDAVLAGRPFLSVSLRYFNPVGAHPGGLIGELPLGVPNNLVPFVTQAAAGILPRLTVFGNDYNTSDGTPVRDYIHVMDLARAHVSALRYLEKKGAQRGENTEESREDFSMLSVPSSPFYDVFNLGTGQGSTVLEVIRTFEQVNGVKLNYVIGPRRPGDVEALYASCDKAREVLGWRTQLTLADALKDAWRWQKGIQSLEESG